MPWAAALVRYEGEDWFHHCGGSLITRSHVLTAGHCFEPPYFSIIMVKVRLGEVDQDSSEDDINVQLMDILNAVPHPEFAHPR